MPKKFTQVFKNPIETDIFGVTDFAPSQRNILNFQHSDVAIWEVWVSWDMGI